MIISPHVERELCRIDLVGESVCLVYISIYRRAVPITKWIP
jgi:hypothetical protein